MVIWLLPYTLSAEIALFERFGWCLTVFFCWNLRSVGYFSSRRLNFLQMSLFDEAQKMFFEVVGDAVAIDDSALHTY
jgi:hypothetical protein